MSRKRMLIAFIFTLTLTLGASEVFAATKTVTIRVKGMTCSGCASSLEKALKSTEGVREARVSFERGPCRNQIRRSKSDGRKAT